MLNKKCRWQTQPGFFRPSVRSARTIISTALRALYALFGSPVLQKIRKGLMQTGNETAANIVKRLYGELQKSEKSIAEFSAATGITRERCAAVEATEWRDLTLAELAAISLFLGLDTVEQCLSPLK